MFIYAEDAHLELDLQALLALSVSQPYEAGRRRTAEQYEARGSSDTKGPSDRWMNLRCEGDEKVNSERAIDTNVDSSTSPMVSCLLQERSLSHAKSSTKPYHHWRQMTVSSSGWTCFRTDDPLSEQAHRR